MCNGCFFYWLWCILGLPWNFHCCDGLERQMSPEIILTWSFAIITASFAVLAAGFTILLIIDLIKTVFEK